VIKSHVLYQLSYALTWRMKYLNSAGFTSLARLFVPILLRWLSPGPAAERGSTMPIVNRVADLHDEITAWRHEMHAHPELLYDVHRTAASVAEKLKSFGCDEVVPGIGRTGVVGVIRGRKAGAKVVGLRADMDALPLEEETGLPYKSATTATPRCCWGLPNISPRRAISPAPRW
jgi:hypothetical protein